MKGLNPHQMVGNRGGRGIRAVIVLEVVALVVSLAGNCPGQERKYAKVRYFPEQRADLKAYLNETTPTLNWRMDEEYLYTGIEETTSALKVGMLVLGPDVDGYTDFIAFATSGASADHEYDCLKAIDSGARVFLGFPRPDRNFLLYIDSEPTFSRVYRELREKQESALAHFREVHKGKPDVYHLSMSFRAEDVKGSFPLLQEAPAIPEGTENPFGGGKAGRPGYVGFRNWTMFPDTRPVWVEKWDEYYLVWRTRSLEDTREEKKR